MKTLVIRPGAIGDAILSLPAIEYLHPDEIWCPQQNIPLFEWLAPARSLVSEGIDSLRVPQRALGRLGEFDRVISWYGTLRDDFRRQVSHLPFTFLRAVPPEEARMHAADYYLAQVGAPAGGVPRLPGRRAPGDFAVIHPFSGGRRKNWPLAAFRQAARLIEEQMPVEWCAGPEEPLDGARRFPDLGRLGAWLAGARVYVGNDSGITHLAAALGVPVVALFGPTDPQVWGPRGAVTVLSFQATPAEVASAALARSR